MSRRTGSLHAVRTPEPPPLPDCEYLLSSVARRPGELHEPVRLQAPAARALAENAAAAGLEPDVAATLMLDAQMLREDLETLGMKEPVPDHGARLAGRHLSAGEADYVRSLVMRRPKTRSCAVPRTVAIPVRLLAAADAPRLDRALQADLGQAVAWEIAALADAMTMREWGLRYAARVAIGGR